MVEFSSSRALRGLAKLSGSFAVSGLAAGCVAHGKTHQAFAYYWDLPYPVRRSSGKIVTRLPDGIIDVKYPVKDLLRSPWDAFIPESLAWAFCKSLCIYSAIYLQGWLQRLNDAEDEAREQALLDGIPEDDIELDVPLPDVTFQDAKRIVNCSVRGGIREASTTFIRRNLEWAFSVRLSDRISWKLVKDFPPSAKRKLQKHNPFVAMALSARTTLRSGVFMQVADFIFCTTMDAYRLLVVPFLPESWQRCLGLRQWGFPPAQLHEPNPLNAALDEAAAAAPALDADAGPPAEEADAAAPAGNVLAGAAAEDADADDLPAAEDADAPAPAEGEPAALVVPEEKDEGSPAEWSWRFGLLAKKVTGNAARCCVSLGAASLGAGLTASILPSTVLALACNGADMAVGIFVTGPDLNDWYEHNQTPWRTFGLAAFCASVAVAVLLEGSRGRAKYA